ncbi:hypothetical protein EDM54_02195 [Brevibacillus borstelensis]|uniref:hypothetical protein n=1 Tax=Brevibacillus borstelensis TaxID=45462 RepID=UPI000F07D88C|nr:hypothetical protein [Brevibacillus borstelensis]MED1885568.1 hypothetical protein [Brevibacillus borstelensis]RNB66205.1 hypothetical protein EDM54_02195 [Brevibacillus borstelensis]GED55193.1 hypothetical protein BBO01nite_44340 [Brevibacillus borstelensis]
MKKRYSICFWVILTMLLVAGCGQPSTNKSPDSTNTQNQNRDQQLEVLTINLDSKTVAIPISKIDSVKKYLDQFDSNERANELKRVETTTFTSKSGTIYSDIRYGCGMKLCDHTLVQIKNNDIKTLPLHSGSIFMERAFSPDDKYLAVLLGRNEGTDVIRHSVMIIELDSFALAELENTDELINLTSSDFSIPILSMSWENETTLKAVIPDTKDYTFDTLKNWNAGENKTKEILLIVK